jgi:hypothetical protein
VVKKQNKKLKAKGKLHQPVLTPRVAPRGRRLEAQVNKSQRRLVVGSVASIAKPTVAPTRPTTPWTAVAMTAIVGPLQQQQVSPLSPRSPTRSLGATRVWPLCKPCSKPM